MAQRLEEYDDIEIDAKELIDRSVQRKKEIVARCKLRGFSRDLSLKSFS